MTETSPPSFHSNFSASCSFWSTPFPQPSRKKANFPGASTKHGMARYNKTKAHTSLDNTTQ